MESMVFDYAIIGAGAGGLHLAIALAEDPHFKSKRLLIIEKDPDRDSYPTWCFWEKGYGKWDHIISKKWEKTTFFSRDKRLEINLGAYTYKMVRGKDFHQEAKNRMNGSKQVTWVQGEVESIIQGKPNKILTFGKETYHANHVFDSRVAPEFFAEPPGYSYLKQHFEGWVIETKEKVFDQDTFTMMDYRMVYPGTTSFTYILPFTPNKALIEYTFFSSELVDREVYKSYLQKYISEYLGVDNFKLVDKESGVIPMSDYPFGQLNNAFLTKIGTAGGWVKSSTGYSFKNAEKRSQQILDNLKANKMPGGKLTKKRFRVYDALFLDVLSQHNKIGPELFSSMYHKNDIERIFSFLDEETNILEELQVMNTFNKWLFLKVILKRLLKY